MPYLMSHFWPGGTEEQYRTTLAAVHPPDGLPVGQSFHAAGPTEGGYLVVALWDSREQADDFVRDELMAKMPAEGGFTGRPEERTAEASNMQTA